MPRRRLGATKGAAVDVDAISERSPPADAAAPSRGRDSARVSRAAAALRDVWRNHRRILAVQVPLAAAAVAIFLWRVDVDEAVRRLGDAQWGWALIGVLGFTVSKAVHAWRWRFFLRRHQGLPYRPLFGFFLISNLVNALVPLRAGDLLRVELPSRRFGVPRAELASSVFVVESVLDGVAFVLLLAGAALFWDIPFVSGFLVFIAVAILALFALLIVLARIRATADLSRIPPLRWMGPALRVRAARVLAQLLDGMASLEDLTAAAQAVGISLAAWGLEVGVYWMMGEAFGVDLDLHEALIVMIAANMIVSIPITPWDVGPYEIAVTEAMVLAGASRAEASSYAVGSHLLLLLWVGVTGLAAMWTLGLRPADLMPDRSPTGQPDPTAAEEGMTRTAGAPPPKAPPQGGAP